MPRDPFHAVREASSACYALKGASSQLRTLRQFALRSGVKPSDRVNYSLTLNSLTPGETHGILRSNVENTLLSVFNGREHHSR